MTVVRSGVGVLDHVEVGLHDGDAADALRAAIEALALGLAVAHHSHDGLQVQSPYYKDASQCSARALVDRTGHVCRGPVPAS